MAAGAGFDWCLIDGEHGPNTLPDILAQLQALEGRGASAVVRVPQGDAWIVKQVLDLGAQTLLVPMVNTVEEAEGLVKACRYPPQGIRGMGAAVARAASYGQVDDYATTANSEICLLVQAETRRAMDNLGEIAAVDGVDGVFIGPADLSADMGFPGQMRAPEVVDAIEDGIGTIRAAGKAAGIIDHDDVFLKRYAELGVTFLGLGADVSILSDGFARMAELGRSFPAKV